MTFRRQIIAAAALAAFSLAAPITAQAQTVLKASDVHPAGYPNVVAVENLGKKLEAATKGKYKMQMFAGGVLGSEKEVVEQTQVGAIQIARISLGILGPVVPDVNIKSAVLFSVSCAIRSATFKSDSAVDFCKK